MAKQKVRNASPGPRILYEKGEGDAVSPVTLAPGEEREVDLANADDPVIKGMIDNGELVLGGGKAELSEEEQQKATEKRYLTDPMQVTQREAAEAAGRTPGLADPLPEDVRKASEAESEDKPKARAEPARSQPEPPKGGRR